MGRPNGRQAVETSRYVFPACCGDEVYLDGFLLKASLHSFEQKKVFSSIGFGGSSGFVLIHFHAAHRTFHHLAFTSALVFAIGTPMLQIKRLYDDQQFA